MPLPISPNLEYLIEIKTKLSKVSQEDQGVDNLCILFNARIRVPREFPFETHNRSLV